MIKFSRSRNSNYALQSSETDTIYFTNDTNSIVMGGQEYGFSSEARGRLEAAEQAVEEAKQSALQAKNYVEDVSSDLYKLYGIIGSLPDGSAVSERVAQIEANKVNSWSNIPNDKHYPSEKLVKDTVDSITPEFLSNQEIQILWDNYGNDDPYSSNINNITTFGTI